MNNTTMAHVGAEIAVLGGVVFYFHRKNSQLQEMIVELAQSNQMLLERIGNLENDMDYLGKALSSMHLKSTQTVPPTTPRQSVKSVKQEKTSQPANLTFEQMQQMMAMMKAQEAKSEPAPEKTVIEPIQVYDNNADLDKELENELGELQTTRVVCDGQTCSLVE